MYAAAMSTSTTTDVTTSHRFQLARVVSRSADVTVA
jgi:hypothetical protein